MSKYTLVVSALILAAIWPPHVHAALTVSQTTLSFDANTGFVIHCDNPVLAGADRIAIYGPVTGHDGVFLKSDLNYCGGSNHNVQTDFNPGWMAGVYHFVEYYPADQTLPFPKFLEDEDQVDPGSIGKTSFTYIPTAVVPAITFNPAVETTIPGTFFASCSLGKDLLAYRPDNSFLLNLGHCDNTEITQSLPAGIYNFVAFNRTTDLPRTFISALADSDFILSASYTILPYVDVIAPVVSLVAPTDGKPISGTVIVSADATDNLGVTSVQFQLDGTDLGPEDKTAPYSIVLDTTTLSNGIRDLTATARDAAGNTTTSAVSTLIVANPDNQFEPNVTRARFHPREGSLSRLVGGTFEGSNTSSTSGYVVLGKITTVPTLTWTEVTLNPTISYRYLRYVSPNGGYGNLAELEFYNGATKLTGTIFGSPGSYLNLGNDYTKVFDGNVLTFFDAPYGNNQYMGIDLGIATPPEASPNVTRARFYPREGSLSRLVGGTFEGSNTSPTSGYVVIGKITTVPTLTWTEVNLNPTTNYRYLRYVSPKGGYGNLAELEFYNGTTKLSGTIFGSPGSYLNLGNDYTKVFDGNVLTFFDAPFGNNQYMGIDLGIVTPPPTIPNVTRARFHPREGSLSRLVGGTFEGSNTSSTSGYVVLGKITTVPTLTWTEVTLNPTISYRYLRYVSPNGGYGNLAELEFYNGATKLTGTIFGSPGSYLNLGNDYTKVFDGNVLTFFDAPYGNNQYMGIDLGIPSTISTTH